MTVSGIQLPSLNFFKSKDMGKKAIVAFASLFVSLGLLALPVVAGGDGGEKAEKISMIAHPRSDVCTCCFLFLLFGGFI